MTPIPARPKIYHITHVNNLASIVAAKRIWSDAKRIEKELPCEVVGMTAIKRRRLEELDVSCHPGTKVGEYVPFYFCPRSIMLYIFHRRNHPELKYRDGQAPIVHLQADLHDVVEAADRLGTRWAFSTANAGTRYSAFFASLRRLDKVDWAAVKSTDFRESQVKDGKQAEFLVHGSFPWSLVEKVGVANAKVLAQVQAALARSKHQPPTSIEAGWYF